MCRLYGFCANELTKVECSLVRAQNALLAQSRSDSLGRTHADGWGIACYPDAAGLWLPLLVRQETAAFSDVTFSHQAESTYARTVVAHVRLATVGVVGPLNSHPFTYGAWTLAHNGTLPGFDRLESQLAAESEQFQAGRRGQTDSEQFFVWLLNRCRKEGVDLDAPDLQHLQSVVTDAVVEIDHRCGQLEPEKVTRLTFVFTNGHVMVACRWNNPLNVLKRAGVHDCEICGIPHIRHENEVEYRAVVFASEPITDEAWEQLPDNSLAVLGNDLRPQTTIIGSSAAKLP